MMKLLERDSFLQELDTMLKEALAGQGRVALVSGEAGIGKTSLVEHFTRSHQESVRVLWGACDSLFTPRPLGPLHDIAMQVEGDLCRSAGHIFSVFCRIAKSPHHRCLRRCPLGR